MSIFKDFFFPYFFFFLFKSPITFEDQQRGYTTNPRLLPACCNKVLQVCCHFNDHIRALNKYQVSLLAAHVYQALTKWNIESLRTRRIPLEPEDLQTQWKLRRGHKLNQRTKQHLFVVSKRLWLNFQT